MARITNRLTKHHDAVRFLMGQGTTGLSIDDQRTLQSYMRVGSHYEAVTAARAEEIVKELGW